MLACARIGAIHSVVLGGVAAAELAKRIDDSNAKIVLAASCGIEPNSVIPYKRNSPHFFEEAAIVDEVVQISSHKPCSVIVFQRTQCAVNLHNTSPKDYDWKSLIDKVRREGKDKVPCREMKSTDVLYLLYTWKPKDTPSY